MIALRPCESDADLEQWLEVRRAVLPGERTGTLEEQRAMIKPGDLHLLAHVDGALAGSGLSKPSDTGGAFVAPRVIAEQRGRGVGSLLLERLCEHAVARGFDRAGTHVDGADVSSIAFAHKFGFEERRREVQQVRDVTRDVPVPRAVDGVAFVSVAERPELVRDAYPLAQQGYEDMPIDDVNVPLEDWLRDEASLPHGSFVALVGAEIVGYAGLLHWPGEPTKAEHGLTVVRRDHRGRGIAAALKERELAWAAANGLRELVTWTQTGNENMQAVNTRLGYVVSETSITFGRALPL
jgi:mycothiol synthase